MSQIKASARHARAAPSPWIIAAALVPVALVALPLVYVALRAAQAGLGGVWEEIFRGRTYTLLANTLILATGVTVTASLIGVAVAWCVERSDLTARHIWRVAASLPLAMPAFVSSYAWSSIDVRFQSMAGAILILSLSSYPLVYLPVAAALRSTDPGFEDVSRSLGNGPWRTFIHALLPQLLPALGGGALLVLTHMFAEFGALALLRVQTFTTAIFQSYELQFDSASAALQSLVLMTLCIPAAYAEMRMRGVRRVARVGRGSARAVPTVRLKAAAPFVLAFFILLGVLGLGVPLTTLAYWLLHGSSGGLGYADILPALRDTIVLSLSGAVLTSILAIPLVLLAVRHRGRLSAFAERLPYIVHGLPGVVVALALVFLSIRLVPAIYQSSLLLLCAYAILFLPLAQSSLRASVELVSPQIEHIARSLGRRPLQAFISVVLPNIAPGIGAALALMMLEIMRELTATLMLAPTGVSTLAVEVWSYTYDAEYAAAAPFAALLVLVSIIPVWFFTRRMLRHGDTL
ncbi:ABC transporter permease [Allopusillimonas ginsengisoli]|uniref:ABC transporter permease n=1 Tax=Allopusillimonas ginsengisoli TaxID=453575 RepID=UPI0019819792